MVPLSPIQAYLASSPAALQAPLEAAVPSRINPADLQSLGRASATAPTQGAEGFSRLLDQFTTEVNARQLQARQSVNDLLAGRNISLHQAIIASEEAGISFQLMVEVRNKLLESYQELMRMQI